MSFFESRRIKKQGRDCLAQARHALKLRGDIASIQDLQAMTEAETALSAALSNGDSKHICAATETLATAIRRVVPAQPHAIWRENLEILVIAIAVAMAFRTYFLQPFKIPTGSMTPTLYGIHFTHRDKSIVDIMPLKLFNWLARGEWHQEWRATASGKLGFLTQSMRDHRLMHVGWQIGEVEQVIPATAKPRFDAGTEVKKGDVIASQVRIQGDHIFVNKVKWNFTKPKLGEIVVFRTQDIPMLRSKEHYIKRMIGLPGQAISVDEPNLLIDGVPVTDVPEIARIATKQPGYWGYRWDGQMKSPSVVLQLGEDQYAGFGDYTKNSQDSRYWGAIPEKNLVGPACLIYWPILSRHHSSGRNRWGLIR